MAGKPTSFEQARALMLGLKMGAKMPDKLPKNVKRVCYCLGLLDNSPAGAGWRLELRGRAIGVRNNALWRDLSEYSGRNYVSTNTYLAQCADDRAKIRSSHWRQLDFRYATAKEAKVLRRTLSRHPRVVVIIPGYTKPYIVGQSATSTYASGRFKTIFRSTLAIVCGEMYLTKLMKGTK